MNIRLSLAILFTLFLSACEFDHPNCTIDQASVLGVVGNEASFNLKEKGYFLVENGDLVIEDLDFKKLKEKVEKIPADLSGAAYTNASYYYRHSYQAMVYIRDKKSGQADLIVGPPADVNSYAFESQTSTQLAQSKAIQKLVEEIPTCHVITNFWGE